MIDFDNFYVLKLYIDEGEKKLICRFRSMQFGNFRYLHKLLIPYKEI